MSMLKDIYYLRKQKPGKKHQNITVGLEFSSKFSVINLFCFIIWTYNFTFSKSNCANGNLSRGKLLKSAVYLQELSIPEVYFQNLLHNLLDNGWW